MGTVPGLYWKMRFKVGLSEDVQAVDHAAVGNGITAAGVNVDGGLAVHEDLDVEAVVVITVIYPECDSGTVGLGILYLVVQQGAGEVQRFVSAGTVADILA